jgi:hypothetical protein
VQSNAGADSFDDWGITVLPRLKNNKAIGVTDVNTPEEHGWQQPIYLHFGDILSGVCE